MPWVWVKSLSTNQALYLLIDPFEIYFILTRICIPRFSYHQEELWHFILFFSRVFIFLSTTSLHFRTSRPSSCIFFWNFYTRKLWSEGRNSWGQVENEIKLDIGCWVQNLTCFLTAVGSSISGNIIWHSNIENRFSFLFLRRLIIHLFRFMTVLWCELITSFMVLSKTFSFQMLFPISGLSSSHDSSFSGILISSS